MESIILIIKMVVGVFGTTWLIDKITHQLNKRKKYKTFLDLFKNDVNSVINQCENTISSIEKLREHNGERTENLWVYENTDIDIYEINKSKYIDLMPIFNKKGKADFRELFYYIENSIKLKKLISNDINNFTFNHIQEKTIALGVMKSDLENRKSLFNKKVYLINTLFIKNF